MPFGNVTTLYLPRAAVAGSSLWGTDVRKLLDAVDVNSDANSVTNHGTGGAVNRTVDPYTTKTTDDVEANFGWAITPSDMGSVSGALRFFPAANHTYTGRMGHNGAAGATGTLKMSVFRVGPTPSFTRTLLGSNTASVVLPATSGEVTATVTVALPEVIFAADETVQYAFEFDVAGIVGVGRTATFFAGTQSGVASRIAVPTLGVLAETTGTAAGVGSADAVTGKVLNTVGTATGLGSAAGTGASRADTTGTATGSGTAAGLASSISGTTGTASGSSTVAGAGGKVLGTVGTVEPAGGGTVYVNTTQYVFMDD